LFRSELSSFVKERFGVPVRSSSFRLLHLPKTGTSVPKTITSTATKIKRDNDQPPCFTAGVVAAAAGGLTVSEGVLAAATGVVVSAVAGMTVSEDGLSVAAAAAVAVFGAETLLGRADGRIGWAASAVGVLTVAEDGLAVAAGAAAFAAGGLTVSEDGLVVTAGAAAAAAGGLTVSEDGLAVTAGEVAAAAGGLTVSEDGLLAVAAGASAAPAGGMTVSEDGLAVANGAAAATVQWSEIMFSSVTAKLLSAAPELTAPLALWPMRFTSWPRCGLRSTLLVVILKIWRVPSSAIV
jgi:hypothetical protein